VKQRVIVQALIQKEDKVLLLRRSEGSPFVSGKYEIPGGKMNYGEQPEDAVKRHLQSVLGSSPSGPLQLFDAISFISRDQGDIHYILLVFSLNADFIDKKIRLHEKYSRYLWQKLSGGKSTISLRDSAEVILAILQGADAGALAKNSAKQDTLSGNSEAIMYSDGGSRGNPGPSAAGFVIMNRNEQVVAEGGVYLGITTNNQAEYHGVRLGLERALELNVKTLDVYIDSMLVVNQMKNRDLWPIHERIRDLVAKFEKVNFRHVPREKNTLADGIVNRVLDDRDSVQP
jgi:ribonuclease HI/ADP-ribose pyrophosphatase YjhB (NUDIX family)